MRIKVTYLRELIAKLMALCKRHHALFHRAEQIGNILVLASVSVGIHELEAAASGCVALILVIIVTVGDDVA